MMIRELSRDECLHVLARTRLARLACSQENQPYVVPVYLGLDESSGYLYGFTTPGQKVAWMRANPLVCVEVDEVATFDEWVSVIAIGRFEELAEPPEGDDANLRAPERPRSASETVPPWSADSPHRRHDAELHNDERNHAWSILKTHPMWSEPGFAAWTARAKHGSAEPLTLVYYRIRIDRITGHEAKGDSSSAKARAVPAASPVGRWDWLVTTLSRVFGTVKPGS
jgi:uncharacterized protein